MPPTPITPDARERLESWGMTESFVTRLQELTSSMRYDLCTQKAADIVSRGGYIYENPEEGTEEVLLPDFQSFDNRLAGACADLSIQFLKLLHTTGYLDELNKDLEQRQYPKIKPCFVDGQSRTHFNQPSSIHTWTGLLAEGADREDMITVDAAFQEISPTHNNGFEPQAMRVGPSRLYNWTTSASFRVNTYGEDKDGSQIDTGVLGLSSDKELIFGIGFVKDTVTNKVNPVVNAKLPSGDQFITCHFNPRGDVSFDAEHLLSDTQKVEMKRVLEILGKISLLKDQTRGDQLKNDLQI